MFPIILAGLLSRTAGVAGGVLLGWVLGRMTAGGAVVPFRRRETVRDGTDTGGAGRDAAASGTSAPAIAAPCQEHGLPLRLRQRFNERPESGLVPTE